MVSERDSKAEDPAAVGTAGGQASRQATLRAAPAAQIDGSVPIESDDRDSDGSLPIESDDRPAKGRGRLTGWLVIGVPAVTSFVVGGYEIGGPSLWRDEAYTKDAISRPVGQIFTMLGHMDAVHGAYYVLMHVVAAAIGTSATALRFPSLCAMVVATACTAAIGRRAVALAQRAPPAGPGRLNVPALTGFLSGMVFATAPAMTYYAQMARSYAIVTMLATIASYLLLRA
jgi:mannosyltransferase